MFAGIAMQENIVTAIYADSLQNCSTYSPSCLGTSQEIIYMIEGFLISDFSNLTSEFNFGVYCWVKMANTTSNLKLLYEIKRFDGRSFDLMWGILFLRELDHTFEVKSQPLRRTLHSLRLNKNIVRQMKSLWMSRTAIWGKDQKSCSKKSRCSSRRWR